jgi:hypothetical protein
MSTRVIEIYMVDKSKPGGWKREALPDLRSSLTKIKRTYIRKNLNWLFFNIDVHGAQWIKIDNIRKMMHQWCTIMHNLPLVGSKWYNKQNVDFGWWKIMCQWCTIMHNLALVGSKWYNKQNIDFGWCKNHIAMNYRFCTKNSRWIVQK